EIRLSLIDMAFILFSAYLLLNMRVDLFTMWAEKTLRTFFLLILFILFQTVFRKSQRENMLWSIILILGITNSLCGFVQFYENYSSNGRSMAITGTFNNSAAFSCYAATTQIGRA